MRAPTFSAQPATFLTKDDTPLLLANSAMLEGTYASVNSFSSTVSLMSFFQTMLLILNLKHMNHHHLKHEILF
jgi:hypothetical protein